MNQLRYILTAFLIFFVGAVIIFGSGKLSCRQSASSDVEIIDYVGEKYYSDSLSNGKKIFQSQCASCHAIYTKVVGPPLAGVTERGPWRDSKILYQYIRNPFSIKNNKYIESLHKQYSIRHQLFPELSDSLLSQLFLYINSERKRYNRSIP